MVGGLLAYFGPAPGGADWQGAESRAPWRGAAQQSIILPGLGSVRALGCATAGISQTLAIGFYGRIDNLAELAESSGLETSSDVVPVVAALYLRHGDEFAQHVLGDYAIIVIDVNRQSLLCVRDWIGMKPLYWRADGEHVALATEVKQVVALLGHSLQPAPEPLEAFVADKTLDLTATFVEGVQAVPPSGQVLFCRDRAIRVWRRRLRFNPVKLAFPQAAKEIRKRLETAISRRLPEGMRAGSMVSGGVDSPAVTAAAAHLGKAGLVPMLERCYTLALPEMPECDETVSGQQVARACGVPWVPVLVSVADYRAWPARALGIHDGPVYLTAAGVRKMMESAKRDGLDTLLVGLGGDEFADQSGDELRQLVLCREWSNVVNWIIAGGRKRLKANLRTTARALLDHVKGRRAESRYEETAAWFWTRYTLEIFEHEAAAQGITIECPLLDYELASFLAGLLPSVKSTARLTKAALREAVRGLVPDSVRLDSRVIVYDAVAYKALGAVPSGKTLHSFLNDHFASYWLNAVNRPEESLPATSC